LALRSTVRWHGLSPSVERPRDAADPPTEEQAAAFRYLLGNGDKVRNAILKAVFKDYPALRREVIEDEMFDDEELAEAMPVLTEPDGLKAITGLGTVYIHPVAVDGVAYVGFAFGCRWDEEHGFGVLTHKQRVVKVGHMEPELAWNYKEAEYDADRRKK
jgi:hypothetical protein